MYIAISSNNGNEKKQSAPEILEELVQQAEPAGASDIHLQMRDRSAEVSFRLDSIIPLGGITCGSRRTRVRPDQISRTPKTYQETLPQDGRISREE